MTSKLARLFAAATAILAAGTADANQYNLQPPQTIVAREIYDLHTLIMWIIVGIFVVVFGAMIYSIIKHRQAAGHKAEQFHENVKVEIAWAIIPFLILIGMVYPATKTVISMNDASSPDVTIKVTGYQWKWGYDYLQEGISFYSSLTTPREQIDDNSDEGSRSAVNPNHLLEVERSGSGADRQEDPRHYHHPHSDSSAIRVWLTPVFLKA